MRPQCPQWICIISVAALFVSVTQAVIRKNKCGGTVDMSSLNTGDKVSYASHDAFDGTSLYPKKSRCRHTFLVRAFFHNTSNIVWVCISVSQTIDRSNNTRLMNVHWLTSMTTSFQCGGEPFLITKTLRSWKEILKEKKKIIHSIYLLFVPIHQYLNAPESFAYLKVKLEADNYINDLTGSTCCMYLCSMFVDVGLKDTWIPVQT